MSARVRHEVADAQRRRQQYPRGERVAIDEGAKGGAPSWSGALRQYIRPLPVASCAMPIAETHETDHRQAANELADRADRRADVAS